MKASRLQTGDQYKDQAQDQWDNNPCGSHYAKTTERNTLEWYLEIERFRYGEYAPWMPKTIEFSRHAGESVLEIGGGMGTDLAQFAMHGAKVTDIDLSAGHLAHAQENFRLRGLKGEFVHHDAETLPFPDDSFDLVYSIGVIHHTPNTQQVVNEIHRVLKPGGKVIIMVYAENSLHYWHGLVTELGLRQGLLESFSMGEIMSRHVEITENEARPLVKVYTKRRLARLFSRFERIAIGQYQMVREEVPRALRWIPPSVMGRLCGWFLVLKARKPQR